MASANTLLKKLIGVKNVVVNFYDFYKDCQGVDHLTINARPNAWNACACSFCGRRNLPGYNRPSKFPTVWRGLDFGGIIVHIEYNTHKVVCPEHGIVTAAVP